MTQGAVDEWVGQVAVVTGAGGSMGSEVVRALLARGVRVAGFDRAGSLAVLGDPGAGTPGSFAGVEVDISDVDSLVQGFERVDAEFGPLSMLVNFAGITGGTESFLDTKPADWDRVLGVNLAGSFWSCREGARRMKALGRGSIVNISSTNGLMARRNYHSHIYAVSKAGIVGLTKTLAAEAAEWQVRVNCVAPGMHLGKMQADMTGSDAAASEFVEKAVAFTPLGRAGTGSDMVGPVLFLLGPESAYMTGQVVVSDGGRTIWYD
ncbi:SDR family NAD(P)-dependent oxidoreductase [Amycolatopsis sp. Poz14]|uniref:SDR family NAD(P)-dependent oxidoreductase n=1 Tax=Amycolatopsis sp. Poz14 TaxID=1447705 RepID=UPI001EE844B2|nr:SDR family oxidoreductase [Amycolatopsis sp. Poz14]MCG3753967.1 SDR family oxidoreductase [Amycolatopsis sp. Poz14]